jgi:hypothetical protein
VPTPQHAANSSPFHIKGTTCTRMAHRQTNDDKYFLHVVLVLDVTPCSSRSHEIGRANGEQVAVLLNLDDRPRAAAAGYNFSDIPNILRLGTSRLRPIESRVW